jgi:hypothetical protein
MIIVHISPDISVVHGLDAIRGASISFTDILVHIKYMNFYDFFSDSTALFQFCVRPMQE